MGKEKAESITISKEQLRVITQAASEAAIKEYQREAERDKEERKDRRLYNTRLLLEKYRGMSEYAQDAVYDAIQLDEDMELQSLLELMENKGDDGSLSVESIQARAVRTRIILTHVNKMLDFYRSRCEESGKLENERRWAVIDGLYISDEEKTVEDLATEFCVDERTVYRYVRKATQDLSALFFGFAE